MENKEQLTWRPFFDKPKEHKRFLCMAGIGDALCYAEHVCLYDKEHDRWLYNRQEVSIHCWLDLELLPTIPDFDKQIIENNSNNQ